MKTIRYIFSILLTVMLTIGMKAQSDNRIFIDDLRMSRGTTRTLTVNMDNLTGIVAVEFTLEIPSGFSINPISAMLTSRASNHQITARNIESNKYKVAVISTDNSPISGIRGGIVTFQISADGNVTDETDYPMQLSNVVMAEKSGRNVLDAAVAGKLKIASFPNLHVESVDCSSPVAGQQMTIQWKVKNDGRGSTGDAQWKDYIWLVPSIQVGTSMEGSKLLATVDNITALASGESYENSYNVALPERIYGNYDLVVTTDMYSVTNVDFSSCENTAPVPYEPTTAAYGYLYGKTDMNKVNVEEENEQDGQSDNFFYKRIDIQVPPLPDLQISRVVAVVDNSESYVGESMIPTPLTSAGLASSSAYYSGKKVKVTATVVNKGEAKMKPTTFRCGLYLSDNESPTDGNRIMLASENATAELESDQSCEVVFTAQIPYDCAGDRYFHVYADETDAVYELANTANNWGTSSRINVLLTPGADFEVSNLKVPSTITSGASFDVSYQVVNMGPGNPYVSRWTDKIYLSTKNTGIDNSAILIDTHTHSGSYTATVLGTTSGEPSTDPTLYNYQGDNYKCTRTISLNNVAAGQYYVYVVVDAGDEVYEYDGENNNTACSGLVTYTKPDLTVELLSVSETTLSTGNTAAISWKLKNIGTGNIQNASVTDAVYAGNVKLADIKNTVSIVAGGEKTLRANITIPLNSQLNGTKDVYIKTNSTNSLDEVSTDNNKSASIAKAFSYKEEPVKKYTGVNVALTGLQTPSSVQPGETVTISYKLVNAGTVAISKNVKHEVFISNRQSFDASSATLCSFTGTPVSTVGLEGEAAISLNVTIPMNIEGGKSYLFVIVNRDKALAEVTTSDNQLFSEMTINGHQADLTITNLSIPESIRTSEEVTIKWTLQNIGDWDAKESSCAIYVSNTNSKNGAKLLKKITTPAVKKGSEEEMTTDITLEDDVVGEKYIILMANSDNTIGESVTDNNTTSQTFVSVQNDLPDLMVSEVTTSNSWNIGETVDVTVKVKNLGDAETRKDKWTENFYLSQDFTLNTKTAINLGSKMHVGKLEKGGEYQATVSLKVPTNIGGYYMLFVVTDATDAIIEKNKANNSICRPIFIEDGRSTPADLQVSKVNAPAQIKAGAPVTVSYTVYNNGAYEAKGKLRDIIYFSKDNRWDENDEMVGVVNGDIALDPGNEIVREATGRVTNVPEGTYYLIVRTNSTHAIVESDYDNNQTVANSNSKVSFAELPLGSSANVSTSGYYKLTSNAGNEGKTLGIYLNHPERASAGLYVSYEGVPSTARYEFSSSTIDVSEQEVLIPDVQSGTYYILAQDNAAVSKNQNEFRLSGEESLNGSEMTLSSREVQFGATSLSIKEGGTDGWVSTDIRGALLDSIMDFRLSYEGHVIPAESITFYDQTSTKASFNLHDAEVGSYDVISELPNGTQATLPDGFKVVPGSNVALGVKMDAPKKTRVSGYAPVSITYVNGGNTDIVIRELLLTIRGGQLSTTIEGFKTNPQTELHILPDTKQDNRGFVVIPPGKQETVNYYFLQTASYTYLNLYIVK